jgi:hypothetical protein
MKKIFGCIFTIHSMSLFAANNATNGQEKPYDYDLFSKDRECEYFDLEALVLKFLTSQPIGAKFDTPAHIDTTADPKASRNIINLDWKWRPGFRVTLGYFNAPKYWEVMGQYTWFSDSASKKTNSPGNSSQIYLQTMGYAPQSWFSPPENIANIHSYADLYYNDLSTLVSRNFYPNPHLRLRVLGGLTSMWTHQTTKNTYNTFSDSYSFNSRYHTKYWGVGFRMGTGADWYWGKDFYLTGKVFWSIITGRWNTSSTYRYNSGSLLSKVSDDSYLTTQNFQFLLGPSYQKSFSKTRLELFVGYEFNTWLKALKTYEYEYNFTYDAVGSTKTVLEDLTLTGVNIRLTLDF